MAAIDATPIDASQPANTDGAVDVDLPCDCGCSYVEPVRIRWWQFSRCTSLDNVNPTGDLKLSRFFEVGSKLCDEDLGGNVADVNTCSHFTQKGVKKFSCRGIACDK